jgi:SAM-dependent methyltransferase
MGFLSVLGMAHRLAAERIAPGDPAVDATVGGGNDTLLLARSVGRGGIVYGFDIQEEALERARRKLAAEGEALSGRVEFILADHAQMAGRLPGQVRGKLGAVMFNLGYLPGGDPAVITLPPTTLKALATAAEWLKPGGVLTIVVYPGHPGGREEAEAVEAWCRSLPRDRYQVLLYRLFGHDDRPYLLAVEKSKKPSRQAIPADHTDETEQMDA